ncbi:Uncharacterised protein [Chlamydia trachomatis]|nr:Uncharacterised protein [Chlamydia trachomatis]
MCSGKSATNESPNICEPPPESVREGVKRMIEVPVAPKRDIKLSSSEEWVDISAPVPPIKTPKYEVGIRDRLLHR